MNRLSEISGITGGVLRAAVNSAIKVLNGFIHSKHKVIDGTTYTIDNPDNQRILYFTSATTVTITLPANISQIEVVLIQDGAGDFAFVTSGGASIKGGLTGFDSQDQGLSVLKRYDSDWNLLGNAS